ncbi:MAG: DALR anticodon-binding domain-containing protein, partial [bacterium]
TLQRGGEKMKLSTRSGEFITLNEMVDELGPDVVRFFFLMRSADSQLVFDWDLALDTSEKNPVYAVQYAHARCCNIFKHADELGHVWAGAEKCKLDLLEEMEERDLVKLLGRLPEVVNSAATGPEPHLLVSYLREVAGAFNQYYTMGNKDPRLRCVQPDQPDLTNARLTLIHATRIVIANALRILGVRAPERM